MRILLVRKGWDHHVSKSGYDRLFEEFENRTTTNLYYKRYKIFSLFEALVKFLFKKKISLEQLLVEIKILILINLKKIEIVHFCFLQNDLILLKYFNLKVRLVLTIHLPPVFWKMELQSWNNLDLADYLIVLDKESFQFFNKLYSKKVRFIPHPIDLNYFQPKEKIRNKSFHCLFVGRFMRDIPFLFELIKFCIKSPEDIRFHIAFPLNEIDRNSAINVIKAPEVLYNSYLSDEDLLKLYQSCDVLIQPLFESTANNVILEAMASKLPIIVNDTGGVKSYISPDNFELITEECSVEMFYDKILGLKNNIILYSDNTEHVQQFSLPVVREKLVNFYKEILE